MLKTALLAGVFALAAPALAQDAMQTTPQPATTTPTQAQTPAATPQAMPAPATPPVDPAATDPAASATTTEPVTEAGQIAQVVETEFPTYDKNGDGSLTRAEFGEWMVALKTASDPATKASDPATVKWIDGAFASADTDKSKAVSKAELTAYLAKGTG